MQEDIHSLGELIGKRGLELGGDACSTYAEVGRAWNPNLEGTEAVGRRVEFTATVEVSDNDPAFGLYSRPSKASLVAA